MSAFLKRYGSFAITGLLAAAVVVAALACAWSVRPGHWLVENIVFEGHDKASKNELRHLAGMVNGTRIFELDEVAMAEAIEAHPWVRSATVETDWPATVRVTVVEHRPVALLHLDRPTYLAADGTPFLPAPADDLDYPFITGVDAELARQHPALPGLVVDEALALLDELDDRGLVPRDAVDTVEFSRHRGFTVRTGRSEILFGLELRGANDPIGRLEHLITSRTVDLTRAYHVDLGPSKVAIVRSLDPPENG